MNIDSSELKLVPNAIQNWMFPLKNLVLLILNGIVKNDRKIMKIIKNKFLSEKHVKVKKVRFSWKKTLKNYYLPNFSTLLREIIFINTSIYEK